MEITGNLCEVDGTFEWKIKDFLLLENEINKKYESPQFSFFGVSWEIWLYPYGQKVHDSVGWIGVYLSSVLLAKPVKLNVSFSFKTVEEKSDLEVTFTRLFDKQQPGYGSPKFVLRSVLCERKSEFLPSGVLTVICTLRNSEPKVPIEKNFLNASAQTEDKTEFLDTSAQTEEGTGIWKLQQHLHEISLNGDISDVILKVKDQEFKSHRCILAARSPVFSAMMKNEMKENVTGIVDIKDIDPNTFSGFLNYLYTGGAEYITPENVTKLYVAADKYQVEVLKENCLDYMLVNVSVENFCDIFRISVQYNEESLKETCIQYFAKHLLDIIKSCKWQSFLCENPIICNELHIKYIELNKDILNIA